MPKYTVIGIIGASCSDVVEADSPDDAINKAELGVSLCHQCAHEVELGDPYEYVVLNEDGETVHDDSQIADEASKRARFNQQAITDRLALVTSGAKWRGMGPAYSPKEQAVIDALTGVANDHGWVVTYDADKAAWFITLPA